MAAEYVVLPVIMMQFSCIPERKIRSRRKSGNNTIIDKHTDWMNSDNTCGKIYNSNHDIDNQVFSTDIYCMCS